MSSIATLKTVSSLSGLVFGAFLVVHLVTHYSVNLGVEVAHSYMRFFRQAYQDSVVEVVIFASLFAHMYANTMIYLSRKKLAANKKGAKTIQESLELRGHRYAGYFLAMSIFGHVGATRFGPLWLLGDSASEYDYTFITAACDKFPANVFPVYLMLLGMAGGWHLIYGTRSAFATLRGSSVVGTKFPIGLKVVAVISHILMISTVLTVSGYIYDIDISEKSELINKLFTGMGMA